MGTMVNSLVGVGGGYRPVLKYFNDIQLSNTNRSSTVFSYQNDAGGILLVSTGLETIITNTFIVDGVSMGSSVYAQPFIVNNTYYQSDNSQNHTGRTYVIPFGKNVSFVLYYTGGGSGVSSQYAVYYNEKIV